jgi:hypothetical protein
LPKCGWCCFLKHRPQFRQHAFVSFSYILIFAVNNLTSIYHANNEIIQLALETTMDRLTLPFMFMSYSIFTYAEKYMMWKGMLQVNLRKYSNTSSIPLITVIINTKTNRITSEIGGIQGYNIFFTSPP